MKNVMIGMFVTCVAALGAGCADDPKDPGTPAPVPPTVEEQFAAAQEQYDTSRAKACDTYTDCFGLEEGGVCAFLAIDEESFPFANLAKPIEGQIVALNALSRYYTCLDSNFVVCDSQTTECEILLDVALQSMMLSGIDGLLETLQPVLDRLKPDVATCVARCTPLLTTPPAACAVTEPPTAAEAEETCTRECYDSVNRSAQLELPDADTDFDVIACYEAVLALQMCGLFGELACSEAPCAAEEAAAERVCGWESSGPA